MEALNFKVEVLYTYSDYYTWDDDKRYELIDGVPHFLETPGRVHQEISVELSCQFANFLRGKPCTVLAAPFDVRLNADGKDDTVVQPDLLVVCDESKFDGKSCKGAPDLVVEILSPGTARHDRVVKLNKYMEAGVREYWIVEPEPGLLSILTMKDGQQIMNTYSNSDTVPVQVLEGCEIALGNVFPGLAAGNAAAEEGSLGSL
jgi:Uma2 family endonuclease